MPKPDDIAPLEQIIAQGVGRKRGDYKFWRVRVRPEGRWLIEHLGRRHKRGREWQMVTQRSSEEAALAAFSDWAAPLPDGVTLPAGIKSAPYETLESHQAREAVRERAWKKKRQKLEEDMRRHAFRVGLKSLVRVISAGEPKP
jgi:hypothetical protein